MFGCNIRQFSNARMAERKFSRGLRKPGMAAQLRESVSQVVRETAVQVIQFMLKTCLFVNKIS